MSDIAHVQNVGSIICLHHSYGQIGWHVIIRQLLKDSRQFHHASLCHIVMLHCATLCSHVMLHVSAMICSINIPMCPAKTSSKPCQSVAIYCSYFLKFYVLQKQYQYNHCISSFQILFFLSYLMQISNERECA